MVASFFPSLQSGDMSLNGFLFHLILHSKIMLLSLMSAGHMFCIKWLHLCATLLNMHPSSEYLIQEEDIKQSVLSPPTYPAALEMSLPDASIIHMKHAEPDTKQHVGAIPGRQHCCGSGIKPLKLVIEWFLFFSQPRSELNTSAINQIVSL